MQVNALFLQLTPEFGGRRFGPFLTSEVLIGSDPNVCQVVVSEVYGVLPVHLRLVFREEHGLLLMPIDASAAVYYWPSNQYQPQQLMTATAVKEGDSFSLQTPAGLQFQIFLSPVSKIPEETAEGGFVHEAWWQLLTRVLVTAPGQFLQRLFVFIASGAAFRPRNIILGLLMLTGYALAAFSTWNHVSYRSQQSDHSNELEYCHRQVQNLESMLNDTDFSFSHLVVSILGSNAIAQALQQDKILQEEVQLKAAVLFQSSETSWLTSGQGSFARQYGRWIAAVDSLSENQIDTTTRSVLRWFPSEQERSSRYRVFANHSGEEACGRGIIGLSYEHAMNLGIRAQPDAFYLGGLVRINEHEKKRQLLSERLRTLGFSTAILQRDSRYDIETVHPARQRRCVFGRGTDERDSPRKILSHLAPLIGPTSSGLHKIGKPNATIGRLAKVYAAALPSMNFTRDSNIISLKKPLSLTLQTKKERWVLQQTAEVIARALVMPCIVQLDGTKKSKKLFLEQQNSPSPVSCLALGWRLKTE